MSEAVSENTVPEQEKASGGWSIQRIALVSAGGLVGLILLIFVIGFILALADVERAALWVQLFRDYLVIILTLESILIIFALVILIFQIARSVNLVQTEVKPILNDAQETASTARGTAAFVGKNVTDPVIRAGSFLTGARVFTRELFGIRRAIKPGSNGGSEDGKA